MRSGCRRGIRAFFTDVLISTQTYVWATCGVISFFRVFPVCRRVLDTTTSLLRPGREFLGPKWRRVLCRIRVEFVSCISVPDGSGRSSSSRTCVPVGCPQILRPSLSQHGLVSRTILDESPGRFPDCRTYPDKSEHQWTRIMCVHPGPGQEVNFWTCVPERSGAQNGL